MKSRRRRIVILVSILLAVALLILALSVDVGKFLTVRIEYNALGVAKFLARNMAAELDYQLRKSSGTLSKEEFVRILHQSDPRRFVIPPAEEPEGNERLWLAFYLTSDLKAPSGRVVLIGCSGPIRGVSGNREYHVLLFQGLEGTFVVIADEFEASPLIAERATPNRQPDLFLSDRLPPRP